MARQLCVLMSLFVLVTLNASAGTKLFSGAQSDTEGAVNSNDSYGEFTYEDCGWLISGNGNYAQLNFSYSGESAGAAFFPFLGDADSVSTAILTYAPDQPTTTASDMVRFRFRALNAGDWSYAAAFDFGYHGSGTFLEVRGAGDGWIELGNFVADFFPNMLKIDITQTQVTFSASDDWGANWTEVYAFTINDASSSHLDLTGMRIALLANAVQSTAPWKIDSFEWTGAAVPNLNLSVEGCGYGGGNGENVPVAGLAGLGIAIGVFLLGGARALRRK